MKISFEKLPKWLRIVIYCILALSAGVAGVISFTSCGVAHMVRQAHSSTTTITKSDGTTESVSTSSETVYDQAGNASK